MDRFIEKQVQDQQKPQEVLKSNMDRFIGLPFVSKSRTAEHFKIQYG